jgi:hypothetical protein
MRTTIALVLCAILVAHSVGTVAAETPRTKHKPVVLKTVEHKKASGMKWLWIGLGTLAAAGLVGALIAAGGGGGGGDGDGDGGGETVNPGNVKVELPPLPSN